MNEEVKEHPLAKVARYKLEQAEANGGHKLARWDSKEHAWKVTSATDKSKTYTLRLKQQDRKEAERRAALNKEHRTGFGWLFTLSCTCQAYSAGMFCWHMAAVRLWWSYHQALTGDQIAERNLRSQKEKQRKRSDFEEDHPQFPTLEGPGDFGGLEEWDIGTDHHREERAGRKVYNPDREGWQDNVPLRDGGLEDEQLEHVMLHNTNILLNGGGKS